MKIAIIIALLMLPAIALAANKPPTISGTPRTAVAVGDAYLFKPVASDAEGAKLAFVIKNRPSWAKFSYQTGSLSGTPGNGNVGIYSGITIYVQDGTNKSVALRPFSIAVLQPANESATLSWQVPTKNTDGTALTNLAGHRIYYGTSATAMDRSIQIGNVSTFIVDGLSAATWYFAVTAITTTGVESARSNIASKTIG